MHSFRVPHVIRQIARGLLALGLSLSLAVSAWAAQQPQAKDLTELSLEALMDIEVTSASKKKEPLFETAAAIFVISTEDIRRSGATSIPELLRMVPGLQVAQIDGNKWAVTARGFNGQYANKLLVLIDGRSVYTHLFAGVYWDMQDVMLEDIERIEVIRGPGATLWGANAVNGIINIITKPARATQGGLLTAGAGSLEQGFGAVRYGGPLGRNAQYRVYAKYFNRTHLVDSAGGPAADDWQVLRGGFRVDWQVSSRDSLTVQGDVHDGAAGGTMVEVSLRPPSMQERNQPIATADGNVLARWDRSFSPDSKMSLQTYYHQLFRREGTLEHRSKIFDLDFQHQLRAGARHELIWGVGYRRTGEQTTSNEIVSFEEDEAEHLFSAFVQDEISVVRNRLRLILGTKLEHTEDVGYALQPGARLLWTPQPEHAVWGAVSRAVRAPSHSEASVDFAFAVLPAPSGELPLVLRVLGNHDIRPETLRAYELGYRSQPTRHVSVDLAAFFHRYRDLTSIEQSEPFFQPTPTPHVVLPFVFANKARAHSYGVEAAARWSVTTRWSLRGGYTWLRMQVQRDADSTDRSVQDIPGKQPAHQFQLQSRYLLAPNLEWDTSLYFVDRLPSLQVPGYLRADVRLGWSPTESLQLSLVGQNLFQDRHLEFSGSRTSRRVEVPRSVYGKITWRF